MRQSKAILLVALLAACSEERTVAPTGPAPLASTDLTSPLPAFGYVAMQLALPAGYTQGRALGINDGGVIVGNVQSGVVTTAAQWSAGTVATLPSVPNQTSSDASAVNASGTVVGSLSVNYVEHPARWQGGSATVLSDNGGSQGRATDINDAGVAVGYYRLNGQYRPAKWLANGQRVDLALGSGTAGQALGINADGDIVGFVTVNNINRAARWLTGFLLTYQDPVNTYLYEINDTDDAVGFRGANAVRQWSGGGFSVLWAGFARSVSSKGRIVGSDALNGRWYRNGSLGTFPLPAGSNTPSPRDVNTCGTTVGHASYSVTVKPVRWSKLFCDT